MFIDLILTRLLIWILCSRLFNVEVWFDMHDLIRFDLTYGIWILQGLLWGGGRAKGFVFHILAQSWLSVEQNWINIAQQYFSS